MATKVPLSTYQKVRAGVWATGIGVIIMAGTWYGAGLKEQRQFEEVWIPLIHPLAARLHPLPGASSPLSPHLKNPLPPH